MAAPDSRIPLPTLPDMIEKVGIGATQLRFIFTGGGVWFADGSELLLISAVTTAVATEWSLSPLEKGSMVTVVYCGVLVGNLISGPLGDRYGRRHLILASYVGIFVFSIVSSFMMNFTALCLVRFVVGFSFGLGQPPWNVLAAEVTPAKWRVVVNGMSQSLFALGEIYSAVLVIADDPTMKNLDWRSLMRLGAIPAALFWAAATFFLQQSPFWLAQTGQHGEAREVLGIMQRDNCLPEFSLHYSPPAPLADEPSSSAEGAGCWQNIRAELSKLGKGPLLVTTIIMCYTTFVVNLAYYGTLYAFPNLLPTLGEKAAGSAAVQLLIGACWEIPGIALGCVFGMYFPRKPVLQAYCIFVTICIIVFVGGATGGISWGAKLAWHIGYYGIKLTIQSGWIVAYVYLTEVYPTSCRTLGTSISFACGRLAATISPLLYEKLKSWTGSFAAFFYLLAGTLFINLFTIHFLPIETFGAVLSDEIDEEKEEKKLSYGTNDTAATS